MHALIRKRRALLVSIALLLATGCGVAGTQMGVILPPDQAPGVLDQCTRDVSFQADGYWQPSLEDVEKLEQVLPAVLDSAFAAATGAGGRLRSDEFRRQYVGVLTGGRRLIYINGLHQSWIRERLPYWRRRAVSVCDGGLHFWGAAYDPQTGSVSQLQFNTRLVG